MSCYIFDFMVQKYKKNSVFSNFLLNFARKKNVNDFVSELSTANLHRWNYRNEQKSTHRSIGAIQL